MFPHGSGFIRTGQAGHHDDVIDRQGNQKEQENRGEKFRVESCVAVAPYRMFELKDREHLLTTLALSTIFFLLNYSNAYVGSITLPDFVK